MNNKNTWQYVAFAAGKVLNRCTCRCNPLMLFEDYGMFDDNLLKFVNILETKLDITVPDNEYLEWKSFDDAKKYLDKIT